METLKEILKSINSIWGYVSIILFVIAVVFLIIALILKKSKNAKVRDVASKIEAAATGVIKIKSIIQNFMQTAEDFVAWSGEDKKNWVITNTKEYCITNQIAYDEELINSTIEALIQFSKKVNANEVKKIEVAKEEAKTGEVVKVDDVTPAEAVSQVAVEEAVKQATSTFKKNRRNRKEIRING